MSTFQTFCDEAIDDLLSSVPALEGVLVHRYAPWDPEQLVADAGERHLAVWPQADAAEEAIPLVTGPGGDLLIQVYQVLYWEDAGEESSRGVADEQAALGLLELVEAIRTRFYQVSNVFLGGSEETHYVGTVLPERSASVRSFQMTVRARFSLVLS